MVDKKFILEIKKYIDEHFVPDFGNVESSSLYEECNGYSAKYSLKSDFLEDISKRVEENIDNNTWKKALFAIIDKKIEAKEISKDSDVYNKTFVSKQTFSKIRSDDNYHPDKDTAIGLCFGLELKIDDALDLLKKAGYSLSLSIRRDLAIRCFLENKIYDKDKIDYALNGLGERTFNKN